jgi:type 1 glutamine amidotransferase
MTRTRKIVVGLLGVFALFVVASFALIAWMGAWNILFPSHAYETQPPEIADDFGEGAELRFLVFSKTNSFRHKDGIPGARRLFEEIAKRRGWALYYSENSALFDADHLSRFDVVVFSNASGDTLSDEQDAAFEAWLEAGGGWIGIHSAGDGSHQEWDWYQKTLIGPIFAQHIMGPQTQEARVVVDDPNHPLTRNLPAEFRHSEEWYSWEESPRKQGFHVLLTVDESTYEPYIRAMGAEVDIRMGDHPIAWSRCVGRGRAFYSAMGHWAEAYQTAPVATLLENALEWTAGRTGTDCPAFAGERPAP